MLMLREIMLDDIMQVFGHSCWTFLSFMTANWSAIFAGVLMIMQFIVLLPRVRKVLSKKRRKTDG
jgi:hypothetical protein